MSFVIIWSKFAEAQLDEIFEYYKKNAGTAIAKKLLTRIINEPNKLIKYPKIGQIEELLIKRENDYRYLIFKNYKLIYHVDFYNGFIKIADVFDVRQNPKKIQRIK